MVITCEFFLWIVYLIVQKPGEENFCKILAVWNHFISKHLDFMVRPAAEQFQIHAQKISSWAAQRSYLVVPHMQLGRSHLAKTLGSFCFQSLSLSWQLQQMSGSEWSVTSAATSVCHNGWTTGESGPYSAKKLMKNNISNSFWHLTI